MQNMSMKRFLSLVWFAASVLLLFSQVASDADLIMVGSLSGADSGSDPGGSLTTYLINHEGGELGYDINDNSTWAPRPPGSPDNWLRVYSDQLNQFYNISNAALSIDSRPFSGPDANRNFPLFLDTQGPDMVASSNNYIMFELQTSIDEGREFYQWDLTLYNGATFSDGSTYQSGVWDLAQSTSYDLPYYNLDNVQGVYGSLNVLPIPEPFTLVLLGLGSLLTFSLRRRTSAL